MELISTLTSWVMWLGIGGAVGIVALLFFAPAIGQVVAAGVAPVAKAIGDGVVWFFRDILWEGLKDMTDNLASVVFVITAIVVGGWYLSEARPCKPVPVNCAKCVAELRKDYKFVPRTPTEKKAYKKTTTQSAEWFEFWK